MSEYHTIASALTVKPVNEPIFSEMATIIELADEAAGLFLVVKQSGKINAPGDNQVCITPDEWPHIKRSIDTMMEAIERFDHAK